MKDIYSNVSSCSISVNIFFVRKDSEGAQPPNEAAQYYMHSNLNLIFFTLSACARSKAIASVWFHLDLENGGIGIII